MKYCSGAEPLCGIQWPNCTSKSDHQQREISS